MREDENNICMSPETRSLLRFIDAFSLSGAGDDSSTASPPASTKMLGRHRSASNTSRMMEANEQDKVQPQQTRRKPLGDNCNSIYQHLQHPSSFRDTSRKIQMKKRSDFSRSQTLVPSPLEEELVVDDVDGDANKHQQEVEEDSHSHNDDSDDKAQREQPLSLFDGNNNNVRSAVHAWVRQQRQLLDCQQQQLRHELESYQHALQEQQVQIQRLEQQRQQAEFTLKVEQTAFFETIHNHVASETVFREIIEHQQRRIQELETQVAEKKREKEDKSSKTPRIVSPLVVLENESVPATASSVELQQGVFENEVTPAEQQTAAPKTFFASPPLPSAPHQTNSTPHVGLTDRWGPGLTHLSNTTSSSCKRRRRRRQVLPDGGEVIHFSNGTTKEKRPDGSYIIRYCNGDIETMSSADGTHAYYFADTAVTKITTQANNNKNATSSSLYRFPTGQVERHWQDGSKRIQFPNGCIQIVSAEGDIVKTVPADPSSSVIVEPPTPLLALPTAVVQQHDDVNAQEDYDGDERNSPSQDYW